MSDNQNRRVVDYTKYNAMTTEELEEILRLDAEVPTSQALDGELILYVMEVLEQRKQNSEHTGKTALEAYESFKRNYMPETDTNQKSSKVSAKHKRGFSRWVRGLTAAAAVLAILIAGSATANAFGFDIWRTVIQWTQETFHFGKESNTDANNNLQFDSFQGALEEGNAPSWLVPTYIPSGFNLMDVKVEQTPMKKIYKAKYTDGEDYLTITVQVYLDEDPIFVEQSEGMAEKYEASGITYYLFANLEHNRAVWLYESYECDISGAVTIEELKQMIDSIQKG